MNLTEKQRLIKPLLEIARAAGAEILNIYNNATSKDIEYKSDNSPLTKADKAANDVICKGLEQLETVFPIISEENKAIPYATRKDYDYVWMVDPLDGTKEFIKRNGEFTVNIALIHKNRSIMGFVYVPVTDEMYYAVEGGGAFLVKNGKTSKLKAKKNNLKNTGINIVASRSHMNDETNDYVARYRDPNIVPTGSSLKFMLIALGKADVYPRLAPTMEWDTAAAHIILEEANGYVINQDKISIVSYNKEDLLNPHFIAYGDIC